MTCSLWIYFKIFTTITGKTDNVMKSLAEYLQFVLEEEGGGMAQTPANTMGMGEINVTDPLVAAPAGGIPKQTTKVYNRRKRKKKDLRDFLMTIDTHKT